MSNAVIYLGLEPTRTQDVNPALRDRGIELIRAEPSRIKPVITLERQNASYEIYRSHFPLYADKNYNPDKWVTTTDAAFVGIPSQEVLPILPSFNIVFSFASKMTENQLSNLVSTIPSLEQTVSKGKPVFILPNVSVTDMSLIRQIMELGPSLTTPTFSQTLNLSALQTVLMLLRIANVTVRTNQYPLFEKEEDVESIGITGFCKKMAFLDASDTFDDVVNSMDRGDGHDVTANFIPYRENKIGIYCNQLVTPTQFDPSLSVSTAIPNMDGLIFPYVQELALPDPSAVASTVHTYFMGFLSTDQRAASDNFQKILRDWGVIMATPTGHILSHLYWTMGLAFRTQSTIRLIIQPSYGGCVLLGAGYRLAIGDRYISPRPYSELVAGFDKASPHRNALTNIFALIPYTSVNDRDAAMTLCNSMQNLKFVLSHRPLSNDQRSAVLENARRLRFQNDPMPAIPNSTNISAALILIASNSKIDHLHLPSPMLFSDDRAELIWSQFGMQAPSFQIQGGKAQDFSRRMVHKQRKDQNNVASELVSMTTRRLGIIMVPLAQAVRDLQTTLRTTTIANPFASAIMSRVSSKSTIKTFEGNSFDDIIVSLRKAANVSEPMNEEGTSKRPRDDDNDENENERAKRVQGFGF